MNSDHITNASDDGEVFEALGIEDEGGEVRGITSTLLALDVERRINNLE